MSCLTSSSQSITANSPPSSLAAARWLPDAVLRSPVDDAHLAGEKSAQGRVGPPWPPAIKPASPSARVGDRVRFAWIEGIPDGMGGVWLAASTKPRIPAAWIPAAWIPVAWIPAAWIPVAWIPEAWIPVAWIPVAWIPVAWIPEAWIPEAWIPAGWIPAEGMAACPSKGRVRRSFAFRLRPALMRVMATRARSRAITSPPATAGYTTTTARQLGRRDGCLHAGGSHVEAAVGSSGGAFGGGWRGSGGGADGTWGVWLTWSVREQRATLMLTDRPSCRRWGAKSSQQEKEGERGRERQRKQHVQVDGMDGIDEGEREGEEAAWIPLCTRPSGFGSRPAPTASWVPFRREIAISASTLS